MSDDNENDLPDNVPERPDHKDEPHEPTRPSKHRPVG